MDTKDFDEKLEPLKALGDPVRRELYLGVVRDGEMSRDQAAVAAGVSRALAAFHLEKLVDAGLLEASFRRPESRSGPGAGRPAKWYRRSALRVDLTLPPRRYEWAARLLARALASEDPADPRERLRGVALDAGHALAREPAFRSARGAPLTRAARALAAFGFEPQATPAGEVTLRNCPFDSLRLESTALICGMNHAFLQGLCQGLGLESVQTRLEPGEGRCCVVLRRSGG